MLRLRLLLALIFISFSSFTYAQDSKEDKAVNAKIEKANDLIKEKKLEDADKLLLKLTKDYPNSAKAWDKLVAVEQAIYREDLKSDALFKQLFSGNVTVTVKDKSGKKTTDNDSIASQVTKMMSEITPSKLALNKMIDNCKAACLRTNEAYNASTLIRVYKVDEEVDTNINKGAIKCFNQAEDEFGKQNYNMAATYYQKAIAADSSFYKARLYLGDAFYFNKDYHDALKYYQQCADLKPNMLEPLKYVADALDELGEYKKSEEASIKAIMIFPDQQMFVKWAISIGDQKKKYSLGFIPRDISVDIPGQKGEPAPKKSPWAYYQEALAMAEPYCDKDGIFTKDNSLTKSKYLEVYAWEYMLSKTTDPRFETAKKMQQKGQLEAFVLVGNFQYDFYNQFKDFVSKSPDKVKQYFNAMTE